MGGGRDRGMGISDFSYYSKSASEVSIARKCEIDAFVRIRHLGFYDHSLRRASFATVLVYNVSSFDRARDGNDY